MHHDSEVWKIIRIYHRRLVEYSSLKLLWHAFHCLINSLTSQVHVDNCSLTVSILLQCWSTPQFQYSSCDLSHNFVHFYFILFISDILYRVAHITNLVVFHEAPVHVQCTCTCTCRDSIICWTLLFSYSPFCHFVPGKRWSFNKFHWQITGIKWN